MTTIDTELLRTAQAWPFEEARRVLRRMGDVPRPVTFETGYGPSGLPHIGTFAEVVRTAMVRHAFHALTGGAVPTRLVCFSDDMDALRAVPDGVPNPGMLEAHLGLPLSRVPDPFGTHASFAAHNNARLRAFLDRFGFDHEFVSASEAYASGRFDTMLSRVLERHDAVAAVVAPTLGPERRATYSPFLPLHPRTGRVMQVAVEGRDEAAGTVRWTDPGSGERFETPVAGGAAKLQWKADWAMRWAALGVDYEMSGKDLIDSVRLSGRICRVLGAEPPEGFTYELFLDEQGRKISKSFGNGLTVDEWLRYGTPESLALLMYARPREARKVYVGMVPRLVDEHLAHLGRYPGQDGRLRLGNPAWHLHAGDPPPPEALDPAAGGDGAAPSYAALLSLAGAADTDDPDVLWGFVRAQAPGASPDTHPRLDTLVRLATAYYRDHLRAARSYGEPDGTARAALADLRDALAGHGGSTDAEALQAVLYDVGRGHYPDTGGKRMPDGRPGVSQDWFATLYRVLLGTGQGPRFGMFVALHGVAETQALIGRALDGGLAAEGDGARP